jgi:hypothetical protein
MITFWSFVGEVLCSNLRMTVAILAKIVRGILQSLYVNFVILPIIDQGFFLRIILNLSFIHYSTV